MSNETIKDWGKVRQSLEENERAAEDSSLVDSDLEDSGGDSETAQSALGHPSYPDLEEQLTLAEQKAHENWEKSVRALAEVDNIRRRAERDVANAHRYALEKFVSSLIPVIDSLEQAIQLTTQHGDVAMREGLELTKKLFLDGFDKHGVKQIDPVGEVFDPQLHEAMSMQPSVEAQANTVLSVFQKGYLLNDRVIRPARVVVVKA